MEVSIDDTYDYIHDLQNEKWKLVVKKKDQT